MNAGRAEVRAVIERAKERRRATGTGTVFFLDEIHRFNKAQQDTLLPAVEEGLVMLIGATTENPYFEVNSALLSRSQIYELRPAHAGAGRRATAAGAARSASAGSPTRREVPDEAIEFLAARSGRRRARRLQRAGARERHRAAARRAGDGRAGRGRDAEEGGPLRQGRRQALRLHLGVDQGDARLGRRRIPLLPGRDARGRRGRRASSRAA